MGSFIHAYTDGGGIRECRVPDDFSGIGSVPFILKFPGFKKCLLASLAASGNQASRTSNIVTIAATAHGIPTGSTYVGFRFFYPGSASLGAGWYDSITDVQTNTISFNAPGANFGSENVNGGVAYTTLTTINSLIIPAGTVKPNTRITTNIFRSGDTTAVTKTVRNVFSTRQLGMGTQTTAPQCWHRMSIHCDETGGLAVANNDGAAAGSLAAGTIDFSVDQTFSISGSLSAASGFLVVFNASVEIVQ